MTTILNKIGAMRLTPRPVLRVLGNTLCPRVHSLVMH